MVMFILYYLYSNINVYNQGLRNIYWLTCQLFFVIFLKFLGIKTVAFYDRKPLK